MVVQVHPFTPNPERPVVRRRVLKTKRGQMTGTFITLVEPGIVYIVQSAPSVKPGTVYAVDWHATKKIGAEHEPERWIYKAYKNLYRARRAFLSYMKGWTLARIKVVTDLHELSDSSLIASYGLPVRDLVKFLALQKSLRATLEGQDGDYFTKNQRVVHGMRVFRNAERQKGSRRYPGFGSARVNFAEYLKEMRSTKTSVVQIGTLIAYYIERLMTIVVEERDVMDQLVALKPVQLFTENRAERIRESAERLAVILQGRPFTHVAKYIIRELGLVADVIDQGNLLPDQQDLCGETAHNLLQNVRDALVLLEGQYELEAILTDVAEALRTRRELNQDELFKAISQLYSDIPTELGRGFLKKVVPEIRELIKQARRAAAEGDLAAVKRLLRQASDKI